MTEPTSAADAEAAAIWAARLAEGELPTAERAQFGEWLDADPARARALENVVGSWHTVELYATSGPLLAMRQAALATAGGPQPPIRSRVGARVWKTAVAAALAIGAGGGVWRYLTPDTYRTGVGERRVVVLADGSSLSLDGATSVRVRYAQGRRRLWLEQGRAKFDVAKDALHPFSVTAGDKMVVATGTAFSVERTRGEVRVILYEGHVTVLQEDGAGDARTVPVASTRGAPAVPADRAFKPGDEMVLPEGLAAAGAPATRVQVGAVDPVASLQWEGGQMVFKDDPLGVVVDRMNRYAARPLVPGDARTAALRISGVFHAGDTASLVQGLAAFGVAVRGGPRSDTLYLRERAAAGRGS